MVLAKGFSHKKYSIKSVKIKYKKPNVKNNSKPFISSFI